MNNKRAEGSPPLTQNRKQTDKRMKTSAILLTITAFQLGATLNAATLTVTKNGTNSSVFGSMLAPGATLINTATEGIITYDENLVPPLSAPFDLNHGARFKGFELSAELPANGEALVLDFSGVYEVNFPYLLSDSAIGYDEDNTSFPLEYVVVNFNNANFAEWYEATPMTITARFSDHSEATAYVIYETCDELESASSYGGLVFFNSRVRSTVESAEEQLDTLVVPEPCTTTLSLLALTGLAMRRRRK